MKYYFNRRRDDAVPTLMARYFSVLVYRPGRDRGRNFMTDGAGRCVFSSRVLEVPQQRRSRHLRLDV